MFYFLSTILIYVLQSKHLSESVAGTLISDILLHFISLHMADIHSTRYIWYFWHDCRKTWDTNFKLKIPYGHLSGILHFSFRVFKQCHFRKTQMQELKKWKHFAITWINLHAKPFMSHVKCLARCIGTEKKVVHPDLSD